jgi:hypothetical protein
MGGVGLKLGSRLGDAGPYVPLLRQSGRLPKGACDLERIDPGRPPPLRLIARAVELAVVQPAEWNRKFIADLAAQRRSLGEAEVMRFGRLASADQAGLGGHEFEMLFVAVAPRFRNGEQALVDAARRPVVRLSYPRPVRHALPSGVGDLSRGCRLRSHWLLLERRHPEREGGFYEAGVPRDQRVLKRQGFAGPISNLLRNAGNVAKTR